MPHGAREPDHVWNIIFTPGTFRYFSLFTRSLLAMSDARVRLVANGCTDDDTEQMHDFAARSAGRVAIYQLPDAEMVPHGKALTVLFDATDDGEHFCFVDSDVKAIGRFMPRLEDALTGSAAVTSCSVAWASDTVVPPGSRDLVGRHVVGPDGFVYGSSYLAVYRRAAVTRVRDRWPVTFEPCVYERLPGRVQARLDSMGRRFEMYDTAKVLNILMQGDGDALRHIDHPDLFHVGGISQYLSHAGAGGADPPWFAQRGTRRLRWDFARWAAATLMAYVDGVTPPDIAVEGLTEAQAVVTRTELRDLVERYGAPHSDA